MKRSGMVVIRPSMRSDNRPNKSRSTVDFPAYVLDHFVVPVTVQLKSSAMASTNGLGLPLASSEKICSSSFLFSVLFILNKITLGVFHGRRPGSHRSLKGFGAELRDGARAAIALGRSSPFLHGRGTSCPSYLFSPGGIRHWQKTGQADKKPRTDCVALPGCRGTRPPDPGA